MTNRTEKVLGGTISICSIYLIVAFGTDLISKYMVFLILGTLASNFVFFWCSPDGKIPAFSW